MPLYLNTDAGDQFPLATNSGWGKVGDWLHSLDADDYSDLIHLFEHGWSEPVSSVRDQLQTALESPPDDADTAHTAQQLLDTLARLPGDSAIVVSDGLSAGSDNQD